MSAYVVDKAHILHLVQAATCHMIHKGSGSLHWHAADAGPGEGKTLTTTPSDEEAVAVANMLWAENVKSVETRYPGSKGDLPGAVADSEAGYVVTVEDWQRLPWLRRLDPVQLLKSCSCYAYQSCEHEGWERSEAHDFIRALKGAAVRVLPGYDAAAWGAPGRATM